MFCNIDNGLFAHYTPIINERHCLSKWRRDMRVDELVLPPETGEMVWLKGIGARYLVRGDQTGGRFAVVVHPIKPRALASPMHTHSHEDEISLVIAGRVGVQIGDRVLVAEPGTVVFKPRGIPHAFWNESDEETRVLE